MHHHSLVENAPKYTVGNFEGGFDPEVRPLSYTRRERAKTPSPIPCPGLRSRAAQNPPINSFSRLAEAFQTLGGSKYSLVDSQGSVASFLNIAAANDFTNDRGHAV